MRKGNKGSQRYTPGNVILCRRPISTGTRSERRSFPSLIHILSGYRAKVLNLITHSRCCCIATSAQLAKVTVAVEQPNQKIPPHTLVVLLSANS